jgi:predicted dehydrogenase
VSRLGEAALARVRDHFGFAFAAEDYRAVLDRRPHLVVVASPHHLHFEHARAALEAGAHVLCEKPMTLDPAEAWALADLAQAKGLHLMVPTNHNFLPGLGALRDRLAEGAIGRLEHAAVSFISVTRDVFTGARGLDKWSTAFFRPERATWQDPAQGGGFAWGQMSHALALLFFLTGAAPLRTSALSVMTEGVDIANAATLALSGGAVASISGAAAMPQGSTALMRVFLSGSGGVALLEFDRDAGEIRLNDGPVQPLDPGPGGWRVDPARPVHAMVDLVLGSGRNQSSGTVNARATATIAAMLASGTQGGAMVAIDGRPERGPA